ncbi:hypothetical protein BHQ23_10850 [Mycobacterium gordonae]|uniref:Uncharacterized protein n=1 Tax=Mycobacterium gordonae TaxID=1778 RepID=A0A1X1VDL0_MYCGO|nr:hypothetical protein BHQ23_10850 [Mycobacterium gordonae]ORV67127.1 hypothetical protein AWC08_09015 [Mycobacterium gordonae]
MPYCVSDNPARFGCITISTARDVVSILGVIIDRIAIGHLIRLYLGFWRTHPPLITNPLF